MEKNSRALKASKYNFIFKYTDKIKIYNSLSGKLLSSHNKDLINLFNKKYFEESELNHIGKLKEILFSYKMIVDYNYNEDLCLSAIYSQKQTNNNTLFLIILPTEACNLRCIYCYEDFKNGAMSIETQESIIKFVSKNIKNFQNLFVSWFGGEPLLELEIIQYLSNHFKAICCQNNVSYAAGITTNGVLLTEETFNILITCDIKEYQVTLDGCKSIHDTQRIGINGEGSFDKIINNLLALKNHSESFSMVLRTNISKKTALSMYPYIDMMADLFSNDDRFFFHFVAIADLTGKTSESIDLCDTKDLFPFYNYGTKKNISFDFYKKLYYPTNMACYASNPNSMVIGIDGKIYKCTVAFNNPWNLIGEIDSSGNIKIDSNKYNLWIGHGFVVSNKCNKCKFVPVCLGKFCPLEWITSNQTPCPPFKKNIKDYMNIIKEDYSE